MAEKNVENTRENDVKWLYYNKISWPVTAKKGAALPQEAIVPLAQSLPACLYAPALLLHNRYMSMLYAYYYKILYQKQRE